MDPRRLPAPLWTWLLTLAALLGVTGATAADAPDLEAAFTAGEYGVVKQWFDDNADAALTPQQQFLRGRLHAVQGRFAEAVEDLELAADATRGPPARR
ncbi:MAG: hypothetical protein AAGD86_08720 [Pseudomonadota bacterium]